MLITPSNDRKVRFHNNHYNTYGLLPGRPCDGGTCPSAKAEKGGCLYVEPGRKLPICYVYSCMAQYKAVKGLLVKNTEALVNKTADEIEAILCKEFSRFKAKEMKRSDPKLYYRLHWSGDLFNSNYVKALKGAIKKFPDIQFWTYTRSLNFVKTLKLPNLVLYISADKNNFKAAVKTYKLNQLGNPNLKLSYLSETNDFDEVYEGTFGPKATPIGLSECPVDTRKLDLDGGCSKCMKCVLGRSNIWFKEK